MFIRCLAEFRGLSGSLTEMDSDAMLLAAGPLARPRRLKSKFMNGKVLPIGF